MKKFNENLKSDLDKRAFAFGVSIIKFVRHLPQETVTKILITQLVRSSTSIGANIVEAQAVSSRKDFANYYYIALKSANETNIGCVSLEKSTLTIEEKSKSFWGK